MYSFYRSSYELFCTLYTGNKNPKRAWKALSADERKKLHNKVTKLRKAYMMEFEKFLKGLNKEQLTAFKNARQNAKKANSGADEADDFDVRNLQFLICNNQSIKVLFYSSQNIALGPDSGKPMICYSGVLILSN